MDALPPIRAELRLVGRRHDASGGEVGLIYDPLRHRFFEIGTQALAVLSHWRLGSRRALAERAAVPAGDVDALLRFLSANHLLAVPAVPGRPSAFQRVEKLIGALLFFRVPLVHPDRLLTVLADGMGPLLAKAALVLPMLALAALALIVRQWDLFVDGFRSVLGLGGGASFLVAVILAKAIHEFGHALAAKRLGCAVPTMGVAVMFGAPLLYTDLSDTWRLTRRRDRLLVASGGILAELSLAAIATWGWVILPDGPARGACFFLATVAWLATLAVNLNPFLRFDGYFMLSDALGIPNLQDRSFALGRRAVRRTLWGSCEPAGESLSSRMQVVLVVYAFSTWAFRASMYLGLAWMAWTLFPKLLAVPLLAAELWVLLMRPIVKELAHWWESRRAFLGTRRARVTLLLLGALSLWLVIPQSFQLALPAVLAPGQRLWIHPPRPAQLAFHQPEGARVAENDVLAVFRDRELDHELAQAKIQWESLRLSEEQAARSQKSARELAVIGERVAGARAHLDGLERQKDGLTIRAPFAGRIRESSSGMADGRWQAPSEPLFLLVAEGARLIAFVDDRDLSLVDDGAPATFHPDAVTFPVLSARVTAVETVPVETIDEPLLSTTNGGAIVADRDGAGRIIPRHGQYRVNATVVPAVTAATMSGTLTVDSRPYSLVGLAFRRMRAILAREASA